MNNATVREFELLVDGWIRQRLDHGISCFDELVFTLPGVYPAIARDSLVRLGASRLCAMRRPRRNIAASAERRRQLGTLPVPHPLDYDWRFTRATAEKLLKACGRFPRAENLVLLGVPTLVVAEQALRSWGGGIVLLDRSRPTARNLHGLPNVEVYRCDIDQGELPTVSGGLAILDPPWYEETICAFLWTAACVTRINGLVMVSLPPVGTRPGIREERARIMRYADQVGLRQILLKPLALQYCSPFFEQNALRAEGVEPGISGWRRGDLAIFVRKDARLPPRFTVRAPEKWVEVELGGIRFRLRRQARNRVVSPILKSVVEGDILPSVSGRHPHRSRADVWTSGNRVFTCSDTGLLTDILEALSGRADPFVALQNRLDRALTFEERAVVRHACLQIVNIIELETKERKFDADEPITQLGADVDSERGPACDG